MNLEFAQSTHYLAIITVITPFQERHGPQNNPAQFISIDTSEYAVAALRFAIKATASDRFPVGFSLSPHYSSFV
jgi:hypothetical protein